MSTQLLRAKVLSWNVWSNSLEFLRKKPKCKDYGNDETIDSIWNKLPDISKNYWLEKVL